MARNRLGNNTRVKTVLTEINELFDPEYIHIGFDEVNLGAKAELYTDADLIEFLEGDNSLSMLNFALNLVNAGDASSRVSLKIKPSVLVGSQSVQYPGYFTITHEFSSGN